MIRVETASRSVLLGLLAGVTLGGCQAPVAEVPAAVPGSWSVTVWGDRFEVFPEVDPLVAGASAMAHIHVTRLADAAPLRQGRVSFVLAGTGSDEVFTAEQPTRPGVFDLEIRPAASGERDLTIQVEVDGVSETIRGGRVRVGTAEQPGGLRVAPAPRGASGGGEPAPFLKEQQWRSGLATAWVRKGQLAGSVKGLARVRPPAGGETRITAPVDGILRAPGEPRAWPYVGRRVERGSALFRVTPRVAVDQSLPTLEAELATLAAEHRGATARLARLEELLALEATSRREVEEARTRVETLAVRHEASEHDLHAARSARQGGETAGHVLRAPFSGQVAEVTASLGATVAAGETLARLVRTDELWLEIAVPPAQARRLAAEEAQGVVLDAPPGPPIRIEEGLQLISVAPELSPATSTVTVLLAAPPTPGLTLGTTWEARILLAEQRAGIVVPATALVDDGGLSVVYLQLAGETFVRQEVHVLERQGDRILVDRLTPGQRLVTRGGEAIRRASLLASGQAHGHAH
ncbi:MAG: efflux RND transporter periplasmic adaptor subunit [Acidobacteriota bacterium]